MFSFLCNNGTICCMFVSIARTTAGVDATRLDEKYRRGSRVSAATTISPTDTATTRPLMMTIGSKLIGD